MDICLLIMAILCGLIGIIGSILPVLPGPPIGFIGLLLLQWSKYAHFSLTFLLIWAVIVLLVTLVDYFLAPRVVKKTGGSKSAIRGSVVGIVLGFFLFPPWGIILLPFFGALIGELIHDSQKISHALKVALGTFLAFLLGTGIKLIVSGVIFYYILKESIH